MHISPILLLAFCWVFFPLTTSGQTLRALEKAGDEAVLQKNYYTALVHFFEALSVEPGNTRLNYKYAEVARQFNAYQIAAEYYGKVNATPESAQYPLATFWLAMMEKSIGWYAEAEAHFGRFLTMKRTDPDDPFFMNRAKKELAWCRKALNGDAAPDPYIRVEQLGKQINSDYSDFAPLERGDTLYYTSYRYDMKDDKHTPARKMSKLMVSVHEQRGRALSRSLNDESLSTAHVAFSSNGQRLYYTLCDYVSEAELRCKIYYRELDNYGKWSRKAIALPTFINQEGYTATQPCLGFDSTRQKEILYYVSDRPGGQGKLDIWYSVIEGEVFSKPENLESINTPENEVSPFFYNPSQTLYFSSDGMPGWGELDVWKTLLDSSQWLVPELLPAPVNTGYDDLYYTVGTDSSRAWLASNRPGAFYLDPDNKACCNDLFRVTYLPKPDPKDTTVVPTIPPSVLPPPDPVPSEPETLEDFLPLALFFDNDEPDKRTQRTTTRKTYTETFDRYYQRKEEYLDEYCRPLDGDDKILSEELMDNFFEEDVRKGRDYLYLFSEILLKRLEQGDQVEIFIKGYTSPRAKSDYNLSLGQRRVSSVRNHFQTYSDGVFQTYLSSGQLRITERSFGETLASREVSDELKDVRNSIYSIGAAKERRVEIVEIQSSK
ncbi:MAG: hypothetical protein IPJ40_05940 [Saprospirales bacterium]|nr:hypothetical protein [Saprospirales bacterium]